MQPASGSYDQVLKALALSDRGSYSDLSYMPVFRASALFYALVDKQTTTKVSFINYWREKNHNPDVGVVVTVRDDQGIKRGRTHVRLKDMTYEFDVRDFIGGLEQFRGSIEIEAFSPDDLKFQFPGLSVFYQTPRGVSYVHANQRVYNTAEDRERGVGLNPWQTGFEVNTAAFDPFIFIVNGPLAYPGGQADLVVLNADGSELACKLGLAPLPAYGVCDVRLAAVDGVAEFLGERPGMCKINLPLQDVHLRLAAGNALKDQSWLSVTHSYFDATEHQDYFSTAKLGPDVHPAFIPFNLVSGLDVDMVLYPIYARCDLSLHLQSFDSAGAERFRVDLGTYRSPEDGLRKLDIRNLIVQAGEVDSDGLYVLQLDSAQQKVPARITYGLNFRVGGKLGSNISSSAYLAKSWGIGKRSWRWGPVVQQRGARNVIMVSAFSKEKGASVERECTLTLHDRSGVAASTRFVLRGNAGQSFVAEELLAAQGYVPGDDAILWYVLESAHSTLDVNQICISADGFIGGDHCF